MTMNNDKNNNATVVTVATSTTTTATRLAESYMKRLAENPEKTMLELATAIGKLIDERDTAYRQTGDMVEESACAVRAGIRQEFIQNAYYEARESRQGKAGDTSINAYINDLGEQIENLPDDSKDFAHDSLRAILKKIEKKIDVVAQMMYLQGVQDGTRHNEVFTDTLNEDIYNKKYLELDSLSRLKYSRK